MKKYRPLLIAGGLVLIFVGLAIYRMPDKDVATPRTELAFSETQKRVKVGDTFTIDLVGKPEGNAVIMIEPHIQFDPTVMQLASVTKSPLYPQVLSTEQITEGKATITVASPSLSQPVRTSGVVAHFTFKALKSADSAKVTIDDQSFVGGAVGSSAPSNMLAKRTDAVVTVMN